MIFDLPTSLDVGGTQWDIDPDFRQVLRILEAMADPDLAEGEKALVLLYDLYVDFGDMPPALYQQALDAATDFIDHGMGGGNTEESRADRARDGARVMDWAQDAPLIFPAVNRVAGFEVRGAPFLHWWTFLGYFMEISGSVYSTVLGLRSKKAHRKRLEKAEQAFWNENRDICRLRKRLSAEERAEKARLKAILGE